MGDVLKMSYTLTSISAFVYILRILHFVGGQSIFGPPTNRVLDLKTGCTSLKVNPKIFDLL